MSEDDHVSRTQRKREALAVRDVADRLCRLSPSELDSVPLDEDLRAEVIAARALEKGAYRRQVRYLASRLRAADSDAVRDALARIDAASHADRAHHKRLERWRERLLEEGDAALEALVVEHPSLDRQALRALMRAARRERETGGAPRVYRELFRFLRELSWP